MKVTVLAPDHTHRLAQLVTPQSPGLAQITLTDLHNWLCHSPLDWHRSHSQTCTTGYATVPWTGTDHTHRLAQLVMPQSPGLAQITLTDLHNWLLHSPLDWLRPYHCTDLQTRHPPYLVRHACWLEKRDKNPTSLCWTHMVSFVRK